MNYINIKETAVKWNVTVRRVQDLCKKGAIPGATRFGHAWMIPADAVKPTDGRIKQTAGATPEANNIFLMPIPRQNPFLTHTDLYNTPGTADNVIEMFKDYPEAARALEAQFEYQRGEIDKIYKEASYFLETHQGFNTTISAGIMLARCALWRGDITLWRKARRHIYEAPCKDEKDREVVNLWLAISDSAAHDTRDFPEWFKCGIFDCLPADSYGVARVFYVKYMFISAHDLAHNKIKFPNVDGLGLMRALPFIIEPMISQAKIERTIIPEIYLHLMAATTYHNLGEDQKAIPHIDKAIELCLPDRLYGALVEHRTGLDNLLDDRLATADENVLKRVRELHKQMYSGWVKIHNILLERNISGTLTAREREVAKLAAFGMSNTEIASRLHIELNSVKSYIFAAMNKVGAQKRTELGLYI